MHPNRWRNIHLTALLAVFLLAAGCTGTETLTTSQETLTLEVQLVNPETAFQSSFFQVVQLSLRPLDPLADEALQADGLGVVRFVLGMIYADPQPKTTSVSIREGVYQVLSVVIGAIAYQNRVDPADPSSCQTYVDDWLLFTGNPQNFTFTDFGRDVFVTVEPGGVNKITLIVDGQALEEAFLDSWTCKQTILCGSLSIPWCLGLIQPEVFVAQGLEFLDIQVE